jgi:hypothetical protein
MLQGEHNNVGVFTDIFYKNSKATYKVKTVGPDRNRFKTSQIKKTSTSMVPYGTGIFTGDSDPSLWHCRYKKEGWARQGNIEMKNTSY